MIRNITLLILAFSLLPSCSSIKSRGTWGEKAIWPLSKERIKESFIKNITSTHVWLPVAGAGAVQLSGYDRKISAWASGHHPIYGTQKNASHYSDRLSNFLLYEAYASVIFTPSWNDSEGRYLFSKVKGGAVTYFSINGAEDFNNNTRKYIKRERPNKSDKRSFPSGHATRGGASNVVLNRNINATRISDGWKTSINTVNTGLSMGMLWSRVEAKAHYTTDVLMGYAVGNFVSGFIFDSLMNLDPNESISVYPNDAGNFSAVYAVNF